MIKNILNISTQTYRAGLLHQYCLKQLILSLVYLRSGRLPATSSNIFHVIAKNHHFIGIFFDCFFFRFFWLIFLSLVLLLFFFNLFQTWNFEVTQFLLYKQLHFLRQPRVAIGCMNFKHGSCLLNSLSAFCCLTVAYIQIYLCCLHLC